MPVTSLPSGPVIGALNSTGSSPVFSTVANDTSVVVIGLSRLAANAAPNLMRSTDGGNTWAAVPLASPGPGFMPGLVPGMGAQISYSAKSIPGTGASTFYSATLMDAAPALYQINVALSAGSMFFMARSIDSYPDRMWRDFFPCQIIEPGDAYGSLISFTTNQLLNLYTQRYAPLNLLQIAAPLTIYKVIATNLPVSNDALLATLAVPSDAMVGFDNTQYYFGANRVVRSSSAQVASITDLNGNAVSSGVSLFGGANNHTVYTAGAMIQAVDLGPVTGRMASTGPFSGPTCYYGISGFTTLLEAVSYADRPANLSALGL